MYNPCASFTAPCTPSSTPAATRQPFPNNVIPTVMISPVATALFASSLYPTPINPALQHNAVNTTTSAFNVDQGDLKIDFKATQKDNISYRFTRAYQNNPSVNSQALLSNGYSTTPIYNTVGDWTRTIGNNLVNDARIGWSHVTLNSGNSWASERRAVRQHAGHRERQPWKSRRLACSQLQQYSGEQHRRRGDDPELR